MSTLLGASRHLTAGKSKTNKRSAARDHASLHSTALVLRLKSDRTLLPCYDFPVSSTQRGVNPAGDEPRAGRSVQPAPPARDRAR